MRKPEFVQESDFRTVLYRPVSEKNEQAEKPRSKTVGKKDTEKDTERVTLVQKMILLEIANNKFITIPELSKKAKINIRNTKNNL